MPTVPPASRLPSPQSTLEAPATRSRWARAVVGGVAWVGLVLCVTVTGCQTDGASDERGSDAPDSVESYVTDVPYVATPQRVVERMLAVARVADGDVVYDLGSGDGRIVLTAVQQFDARGVGIEIVPELVEKSRSFARVAGVTDRASFRRGDLFEADLSEATVVTMYLLPEVIRALRPKLLQQLDPGDRIVSHNYAFDDWPPDTTVTVGDHRIYRWTIPAHIPDSIRSDGEPRDSLSQPTRAPHGPSDDASDGSQASSAGGM